MWSLQKWRLAATSEPPTLPLGYDEQAANALLERSATDAEGALTVSTLSGLFLAAGIDHARTVALSERSSSAAEATASEVGYPVALKVIGNRPLGRSARAGIALDLADSAAVREAFDTVAGAGGNEPIVVQQMLPPGLEVRVRIVHHHALGPVIAVGLGGQGAAAAGTPAMRLPPVRPDEAVAMVDEAGLTAVLGRYDIAIDRLVDLIVRVSHLAVDIGQLEQLDLDPVMVSAERCAVADALGRVSEASPHGPIRRL
jgi:hypothetical protein